MASEANTQAPASTETESSGVPPRTLSVAVSDSTHLLHNNRDNYITRARVFLFATPCRRVLFWACVAVVVILCCVVPLLVIYFPPGGPVVVLMISDGWGPGGQTMCRDYLGRGKSLALDDVLVGTTRTDSSSSWVTDSAAGATAYACGKKTYNGGISIDPETLKACGTLLEAARDRNMATGVVCTSRITHATPAAFTSHAQHRDMESFIAEQQINGGFDLLMGGGWEFYLPTTVEGGKRTDGRDLFAEAESAGITVARTLGDFQTLKTLPAVALFSASHMDYDIDRAENEQPSLTEMTQKALELLNNVVQSPDNDKKGIFLVVEGSRIDQANHQNDPAGALHDALMYDTMSKGVMEWLTQNAPRNGLLVSSSDHDTGGMSVGAHANYSETGSPYHWKPEALKDIERSVVWMSRKIVYDGFNASDIIARYAHIGLSPSEQVEIDAAVKKGATQTGYAIGGFESTRAEIGWTSHGHTGVDVNRYAFGRYAEDMKGNAENNVIGARLAERFELDLDAVTAGLADTPTAP